MNVLCVTPYFYPKPGGLERYVYEICRRLAKKHRIKVLCSGKGLYTYEFEKMTVYNVPTELKISNTPISTKLPEIYKSLVKWCDVVYAHTPVPFYYDISAILKRKPIALVYHSGEISGKGIIGIAAKLYKKFEKYILSKSEVIIGTSKFIHKVMQTDEVVEPGVDLNVFTPLKTKKEDYILFVGQLNKAHRWKGLELLIRALQKTKTKLIVIGDGDMKEYYMSLSKKLNTNAKFVGLQSDFELARFYAKAKVVVLPSLSAKESFGMVLLEANACGTAVIGTKVGGIPYYIRNKKNGLLCDPHEDDLKHTILTSSNKKLYKMGKIGRKIANKYTWDVSTKKTEKILENII